MLGFQHMLQLGIGLGLGFQIVIQGHLDLENVFKKSRDSRVYSVKWLIIIHVLYLLF